MCYLFSLMPPVGTVLLFYTQNDWHKMCRNLWCFQSLVRWHGAVSRLNCMMFGTSVELELVFLRRSSRCSEIMRTGPSSLASVLVSWTVEKLGMLEHEKDSTGTVRSATCRQAKGRDPTATLGLALWDLRSLLLKPGLWCYDMVPRVNNVT